MAEEALETAPQDGPASLREALEQEFANQLSAETPAEPDSTESAPTDAEAQPADNVEQEAFEAEPSEDDSQGEPEVISAPEHWSVEDRAVFDELPSAARQSWLRREKEYEQGIQKKAEETKPLQEAFGPYRDMLKMRGIDEPTAIRAWVAAQTALDQDPVNGLKMLISQYGSEVRSALEADFGQLGEPDDTDSYSDPEVKKLRNELDGLRRRNTQIETQQQAIRQQEAMQVVQQFKEEKDEGGNLLHPFFDDVQDKMRALLANNVVTDIKEAYEQAVWTHPKYRETFAETQRKQAEQESSKRREEAAKRAKKTGKSVNGKSSVPPPPSKQQTMRDDLAEAWNQSVKGEL